MGRVAVFDFDGTLSKGFITPGFLEQLHTTGFYSESFYRRQMAILDSYRHGKLTYERWCERYGGLWAGGLKGKSSSEVARQARKYFNGFKGNIYPESYDLVRYLKRSGYASVLVSIGASEVISLAAREMGIQRVCATEAEVADGEYTGRLKTSLHAPGGKEKAMLGLSKEYDLSRSLGFGDSLSDRGMLEFFGFPVALNASVELRSFAKDNGWLVAGRKDCIEKVGKYIKGRDRSKSR